MNDSSSLFSPTDGYEDNYVYEPFDFEEYAREKARDDDENSPMRVIEFLFPSVIELEKSPSRGRTVLRSRSREKRPRRSRSRTRSRSKQSAKSQVVARRKNASLLRFLQSQAQIIKERNQSLASLNHLEKLLR